MWTCQMGSSGQILALNWPSQHIWGLHICQDIFPRIIVIRLLLFASLFWTDFIWLEFIVCTENIKSVCFQSAQTAGKTAEAATKVDHDDGEIRGGGGGGWRGARLWGLLSADRQDDVRQPRAAHVPHSVPLPGEYHWAGDREGISYDIMILQEIWYLVSKFSIPVVDSDTDILILIDDICRDDSPDPLLDNSISDEVVFVTMIMMC